MVEEFLPGAMLVPSLFPDYMVIPKFQLQLSIIPLLLMVQKYK